MGQLFTHLAARNEMREGWVAQLHRVTEHRLSATAPGNLSIRIFYVISFLKLCLFFGF